jgi:hypothetical protein
MTGQNLTIENALLGLGELLRDQISPEIGDPFAAQMARLSCLLLKICANGVDDAAEVRVNENGAIRAILAEAAALVGDPPLAERLIEAGASSDPGLKLTVLDSENHRLRGLLVLAQTALESQTGSAARLLDQRIWQLLEAIEAARAPRE